VTTRGFFLSALAGIVAGIAVVGVLVSLTGCSEVESWEPAGDESACEQASPSGICGVVYMCASGVELCIREGDLDAAQLSNGPCWPSRDERFAPYAAVQVDPPCFWCCGGECARGANAYNGTFCP
jgi:hypothetical protein